TDFEKDMARFKEFGKYSIGDIVGKIRAYKEFQIRQKEKAAAAGKNREIVFDFGFEEEVSARGKGKKGIDSLVGSRKKKRPSAQEAKERERRKRRFADLADDDDFQNPNSLENHKGKLLFLMLLVFGYFQKEMILGFLFETESKAVQQKMKVINSEVKAIKKLSKEHKKNINYLKQLKEKSDKGSQVQVQKKEIPAKKKAVVKPAPKKVKVVVEDITKFSIKDLKKKIKEQPKVDSPKMKQNSKSAKVTGEVLVEDIGNFSIDELKKKMKNKPTPKARVKQVAPKPERIEVAVEDPASFSLEDLKKKMKAELEERKKKIKEIAAKPVQNTPIQEAVAEEDISKREPASVAPVNEPETLMNQPPVREDLSLENLREKMKRNLQELKEKKEVVENTPETSSRLAKEPTVTVSPTPSVTPQPVATPEREMTDTEKELAALKAKMDKLIKKEQTVEEPKLDRKVSIGLTPQEEAAKDAEEKFRKSQIQKELAQKLKSIESGETVDGEKGTPEGQESTEAKDSTMGKVMNFIKSRKAFSWMFSD
ncbi:MAG: hypothetical protein NXH75_15960, partial [Halobacteriovoraceae bacterium]|nr:hypothetical protein [Halobacteriovoraceae bacterium]